MKHIIFACLLPVFALMSGVAVLEAQEAAPPATELAVLKKEVGQWDAAIKMYAPGSTEAQASSGSESNSMVGEYWVVSELDYEAFGQKFGGHGVFGYDTEKGHYVGTWYSSDSPHPIPMVGKWDADAKKMTYEMDGIDGMGNPLKGTVATTYTDETHKTFEMHLDMGGTMHKLMEINYTKK